MEYGDPSQFFDKTQTYEVLNFVTFLARNGISSWDTAAQEELERDIEWLFSDEDEDKIHPWWSFSAWTTKEFSIVPAVFQSMELLLMFMHQKLGEQDMTKMGISLDF